MKGKAIRATTVTQIGIVVRDIDRTAVELARTFGVPVPEIRQSSGHEPHRAQYRGRPIETRPRLAFVQFGDTQIELIEPDDNPSTWREFLDTRGEGVHHIAFFVSGINEHVAALDAMGLPLVQRGEVPGGYYAYLDAGPALKTIVELISQNP